MNKVKLIKQFKTIFGYCKAKAKWDPNFDDPPFDKLLNIGYEYFSTLGIWSYSQFNSMSISKLNTYKSKQSITDLDAEKILDDIEITLRNNLNDIFTILPLKDAQISKSVFFENFAIIKSGSQGILKTSNVSKGTVFKEINNHFGIDINKLKEKIGYIVNHKSKGFLDYPLLVIREHYHFEETASIDRALFTLRFYLMFIRLIATKNKAEQYKITPHNFNNCDHFTCLSKNNNINFPIKEGLDCNYNLDFIHSLHNQNHFLNIVRIFNSPTNDLRTIYMRSIRFLNKAFNGSDWDVDDLSLRVLFTNISAETFLIFDTIGGKRVKLANAMVKLANKQSAYLLAVDEVYKDRSHFVHAGKQNLSKYAPKIVSDKVKNDSLDKVIEMMTIILCEFPEFYNNLITKYGKNSLEEWKKYLKSPAIVKPHSIIKKLFLIFGKFFNSIADKV